MVKKGDDRHTLVDTIEEAMTAALERKLAAKCKPAAVPQQAKASNR